MPARVRGGVPAPPEASRLQGHPGGLALPRVPEPPLIPGPSAEQSWGTHPGDLRGFAEKYLGKIHSVSEE